MKDEPKFEIVYGFASARPELAARIYVPQPRNRLEAAWWVVQAIYYEVVLPAFVFALLFAGSMVSFMFAFGAFR